MFVCARHLRQRGPGEKMLAAGRQTGNPALQPHCFTILKLSPFGCLLNRLFGYLNGVIPGVQIPMIPMCYSWPWLQGLVF